MLGLNLFRVGMPPLVAVSLLVACSDDASLGSDDAETTSAGQDGTNSASGDGSSASSSNSSSASSSGTGVGGMMSDSSSTAGPVSGVGGVATSASTDAGPTSGVGGGPVDGGSGSGTGGAGTSGVGTGGVGTGGAGTGGSASTDAAATSGGTGGDASSSTTGGDDCEQVLCVRPYECATSCDAEPSYVGCCPCEAGLIDQFVECNDVCTNGDSMQVDCNTCDCVEGRWSCTEIACPCGGDTCGVGQYCAKALGMCDASSDTGTCEEKPLGCTADYTPVCGCDGMTYSNACTAAGAGVNIASTDACGS